MSDPTAGVWLCTHEAARQLATQISPSGCGPTAIFNICQLLKISDLTKEDVLTAAPARLRDYSAPLFDYLKSRALAGTTHLDLVKGISTLTKGKVNGMMFAVNQFTSPGALSAALSAWIRAGAVPMLTMNLFLQGGDAWHHQLVYGVTAAGEVCALNPVSTYKLSNLLPLLSSPSFMVIPRSHVADKVKHMQVEDVVSLVDDLNASPVWSSYQTGSQIMRVAAEQLQLMPAPSRSQIYLPFQDVVIPWGGLAGITMFASKDSTSGIWLQSRPVLQVDLPLYGCTSPICMDLTPPPTP